MPVTIEGHDYYTMREACSALGIKPASLYAYVSRGLVNSYRQGSKRQRLYRKSEIDAMLVVSQSGRAGAGSRHEPRGPGQSTQIPLAETWIGYT